MKDPDAVWSELVAFVAHETGRPAVELTPQTTLFGDLRIDGDDGGELLFDFGKRFQVDVSEIDVGRHFGPEGFTLWQMLTLPVLILRALSPGEVHAKAGLEPIRLADLHRSALEGRWVLSQRIQSASDSTQSG